MGGRPDRQRATWTESHGPIWTREDKIAIHLNCAIVGRLSVPLFAVYCKREHIDGCTQGRGSGQVFNATAEIEQRDRQSSLALRTVDRRVDRWSGLGDQASLLAASALSSVYRTLVNALLQDGRLKMLWCYSELSSPRRDPMQADTRSSFPYWVRVHAPMR